MALGSSLPDVGTAASLVAADHADAVVFTESPDSLGDATADLVAAQRPARLIIVGGTAAVSSGAETELRRRAPGASVERLSGTDRIHTAALAAIRVPDEFDEGRDLSVIIANGWSLPDVGAAASGIAAGLADAVLHSARVSLGERTRHVLSRFDPADVLISGGPAAVTPSTLAAAVSAADGATPRRLGGATRTHTAALVASDAYPTTSAGLDTLVVADGWSLADVGIAASLAAALGNVAVIYTNSLSLDDTTTGFVAGQRADHVYYILLQPV